MSDDRDRAVPAVIPMLSYEDPATAIEWLERAFGFEEHREQRYMEPDGRLSHAEVAAGNGGLIMVANPTRDYHNPRSHRAACADADRWLSVPWVVDGVLVHVEDVETHFARARGAGATMLSAIEDAPYGRLYRAEDLEGHRWMFVEPPRA